MRKLNKTESVYHAYLVAKNYSRAHLEMLKRYGNVVKTGYPISFTYFFHPEYVEQVLKLDTKKFQKSSIYSKVLGPIMGDSLVVSDGERWHHDRTLFNPSFAKNNLTSFYPSLIRRIEELIAAWDVSAQSGEARDICFDMRNLTVSFITEVLFQKDLSKEVDTLAHNIESAFDFVTRRMTNPIRLPEFFPTRGNREGKAALTKIDAVTKKILEKIRSDASSESLLARFAREPEKHGLNDQLLCDHIRGFLVAGHDTTAHGLSWTIYLLSQHRKYQTLIAEETLSRLRGSLPADANALSGLVNYDLTLKESLRFYPPAPSVSRDAMEDVEILGVPIKKGERVALSIYALHHHPEFWDKPEEFNPLRFEKPLIHPFQYIPFLWGPRACIGKVIAMLELITVIPCLLQKFSVEFVGKTHPDIKPRVTLRPDGPVWIKVSRR